MTGSWEPGDLHVHGNWFVVDNPSTNRRQPVDVAWRVYQELPDLLCVHMSAFAPLHTQASEILLGLTASGLIIASLAMSSMMKLRLLGLTGSLTFVAYGVLLEVWPVVLTNTVTTGVQVFHLRRLVLAQRSDRLQSDHGRVASSEAGVGLEPRRVYDLSR